MRELYILRMVRKCKEENQNQQTNTLDSIQSFSLLKRKFTKSNAEKKFPFLYSCFVFFIFFVNWKTLRQMRNNGSFIWGWRLSWEISTFGQIDCCRIAIVHSHIHSQPSKTIQQLKFLQNEFLFIRLNGSEGITLCTASKVFHQFYMYILCCRFVDTNAISAVEMLWWFYVTFTTRWNH